MDTREARRIQREHVSEVVINDAGNADYRCRKCEASAPCLKRFAADAYRGGSGGLLLPLRIWRDRMAARARAIIRSPR
jgi:hypothetical protein